MLLKSLELENTRSYSDECIPINFPMGTTLFEGDIGSGKSTILYAIEFALFGLGSFKGTYLLRNGARKGSVTLKFEQEGQEYEVYRSLVKKGKSVQQGECYFNGPSGKQILSPSELKERVLQILKFNEPENPRAQSIIYRYAIFTPQEEMKEVILKNPDDRLQTLRRAFRIEDYKVAVQNALIVVRQLSKKVTFLDGATKDIDIKRKRLRDKLGEIESLGQQVKPLVAKETELVKTKASNEAEIKALQDKKEKLETAKKTKPFLERQITDKTEQISKNKEEIKRLEKKIMEMIEPRITELKNIKKPTEKSIQDIQIEKEDLELRLSEDEKQRDKINAAKAKVPLLEQGIVDMDNQLRSSRDDIDKFKKKIEEVIEPKISELENIKKPSDKTEKEVKAERKELEKTLKVVDKQKSKIEERMESFDKLMKERICPVCERPIESNEFGDRRRHLELEYEKLNDKANDVTREIEESEELIEKLRTFDNAQNELKDLYQSRTEVRQGIEDHQKNIAGLFKQHTNFKEQLESAKEEASKLTFIEDRISNKKDSIMSLNELIEGIKKYEKVQESLKDLVTDKYEADQQLKRLTESIHIIAFEIEQLDKDKRSIEKDIEQLTPVLSQLSKLETDSMKIDESLEKVRREMASLRTRKELGEKDRKDLEKELDDNEKQLKLRSMLGEYNLWISEYFTPTLENIEKHVMAALNQRFNEQFRKWFSILIEDPEMEVRVNEEFTPIIERNNYEQDFLTLSGGEKTSVALAYRLALNTIVQEVALGSGSNLLILDEPTDGFSREQLFKIRDILAELRCPQVILVSHERELEGFADKVYRVTKTNGVSSISS